MTAIVGGWTGGRGQVQVLSLNSISCCHSSDFTVWICLPR